MKTKIRQLVFLMVLFVVASIVSANAQSTPNYPALLAAAQAKLAQYQAALNNQNQPPSRVAGIQSAIAQLQLQIAAYQAQQSPKSAHAATLQYQQNPVVVQRQAADQQRTLKQQRIQQSQKSPPPPANPLVEGAAGRAENPHPVTK